MIYQPVALYRNKTMSDPAPASLWPLADFDLLAIEGSDACRFLQGQLTCNVEKVSETVSVCGACCNLKGRVIADFRLYLIDDVYYLRTTAGMGAVLMNTLQRYIVFSKARIAQVTENFLCYGWNSAVSPADSLPAGFIRNVPQGMNASKVSGAAVMISLDDKQERYELIVPMDNAGGLSSQASGNHGHAAWHLADVRQGVAHIRPGQQELWTPEELNFDLRGLVDFRKGCYTGQEVIARMHYRGKARKRLYLLCADTSEFSHPPARLRDGSGAIAEVVDQAAENDTLYLLVIMAGGATTDALTLYSTDDDGVNPIRATACTTGYNQDPSADSEDSP
jgi:tRNA-modifying protein YgfZ